MSGFSIDGDQAERATTWGSSSTYHMEVSPEVQRPPTAADPSMCSGQDREHQHEGLSNGVDLTDFMEKKCRYSEDYAKEQIGWPLLSAMPDQFRGTDIIRKFSAMSLRAIHYYQGRLVVLETRLRALDSHQTEHLRGLTAYQKRSESSGIKSEYDVVIEEFVNMYEVYTTLVARHKEMLQLYPVPRASFKDMLGHLLKNNILDDEGLTVMCAPDETVSFSKPLPESIVWLLHTDVGKRVAKKLGRLEEGRVPARFLQFSHLLLVHRALITCGALAILIPTGVLFLLELTRPESFSIVAGFTVLFSLGVTLFQDTDIRSAFIVVCGFSAVMVTVMVQMASPLSPL